MDLQSLWFFLLTTLWVLFFVLEGFDFGVAALLPLVSRDGTDRKVALNTIGPHWDANEVALIIAGAGTFAAFPGWYATLFSGFYLPLLVILVLLILRIVALEWRGKVDRPRWVSRWTGVIVGVSWLLPFLWGYALSSLLSGVPIGSDQEFSGSVLDLVGWYPAVGGVTFLLLSLVHGANFLALKTEGGVRERARTWSARLAPAAAVATAGYAVATIAVGSADVPRMILPALSVVAAVAGAYFARQAREGYSFASSLAALGLAVYGLFATLYPRVLVSSGDAANTLTISTTASSDLTLGVMTVVAVFLLPVIAIYTLWSYHVFRRRLSRADFGADEPSNPFEMVADMLGPRQSPEPGNGGKR
jgi:cytochrome bd ubiquinol oxidase subunit II